MGGGGVRNDKTSVTAQQNERHKAILSALLKQDANRRCADCGSRGPTWASINLGVFVCLNCSGVHRSLGVHNSKVRSCNLDTWLPEQVAFVSAMGNARAAAFWEARLPPDFRRPPENDMAALRSFITDKYVERRYASREWAQEPPNIDNYASHPFMAQFLAGQGGAAAEQQAAPAAATGSAPAAAARPAASVPTPAAPKQPEPPAASFDLLSLEEPAPAAGFAAAAPAAPSAAPAWDPFAHGGPPAASAAAAPVPAAAAPAPAAAPSWDPFRASAQPAAPQPAAPAPAAPRDPFDPFGVQQQAPAAANGSAAAHSRGSSSSGAADPFAAPGLAAGADLSAAPAARPGSAGGTALLAPASSLGLQAMGSGGSSSSGSSHKPKMSNDNIMALFSQQQSQGLLGAPPAPLHLGAPPLQPMQPVQPALQQQQPMRSASYTVGSRLGGPTPAGMMPPPMHPAASAPQLHPQQPSLGQLGMGMGLGQPPAFAPAQPTRAPVPMGALPPHQPLHHQQQQPYQPPQQQHHQQAPQVALTGRKSSDLFGELVGATPVGAQQQVAMRSAAPAPRAVPVLQQAPPPVHPAGGSGAGWSAAFGGLN